MNINNLTKEDKLRIVTEAYRIIFERPEISYDDPKFIHFMCVAIECQFDIKDRKESGKVKGYQIIPELLEYKPLDRSVDSGWFSISNDGMESRRQILISLIERFR